MKNEFAFTIIIRIVISFRKKNASNEWQFFSHQITYNIFMRSKLIPSQLTFEVKLNTTLIYSNKYNSNWKKLLGLRKMQEKLENNYVTKPDMLLLATLWCTRIST